MSMRDFIDRHSLPPLDPPANPESPPIEKLLDWLVNYWAEPTVSARDIYTYGPNCIRDWGTTLRCAGILVEQGWLVPTKTRQRNMREWQIVRKPNE